MLNLPGYQITDLLFDGDSVQTFQGTREKDQISVVIKVLKGEFPDPRLMTRIRREYELLKTLRLPGIVRVYDLIPYQNSLALVLENTGGVSLKSLIPENGIPIDLFLDLTSELTGIIAGLHEAKTIHTSIHPGNLIYNPQTKILRLIDFGHASQISREKSEVYNPGTSDDFIPYLSPEQTGRLNREVDYRTDFYSMGVTFYELLTGKLPFFSQDPVEIIHAHLSRIPLSPSELNPAIPQMVSSIVLKLMSKNAEDRYQSASGLRHDLMRCRQELASFQQVNPFPAGEKDIPSEIRMPAKLFGREQEIIWLRTFYDHVRGGLSELLVVQGYSGIGKSALVNQFSDIIRLNGGFFISGKWDQLERNVPYQAWIEALTDLMRILLTFPEEAITSWKTQILNAIGNNGQVLIDLIPETELILGKQPPAQPVDPNEALNRLNVIFQRFISVFAQPEHPLVMFLDDIQWMDAGSLHLLKSVAMESGENGLLIIAGYRESESGSPAGVSEEVVTFVSNLPESNRIRLLPLTVHDVNGLLSDMLHSDQETIRPLAELINKKTQGNPYFIIEFVKALVKNKRLVFQQEKNSWKWDLKQVEELQVTDNVVDLLTAKIRLLDPQIQEILQFAACIGNQFDLLTLSRISDLMPVEANVALWTPMKDGLVIPLSDKYKFIHETQPVNIEKTAQQTHFKFAHDKVQQAAYQLIPEPQRGDIHFEIGTRLLQHTPESALSESIFTIVSHLNQGLTQIKTESVRIETAKLNLTAGNKARQTSAIEAARHYYRTGLEILLPGHWSSEFNLVYNLALNLSECEYLAGNFYLAEELFEQILANSTEAVDKVRVIEIKVIMYTHQSRHSESVKLAIEALEMLGFKIPGGPIKLRILQQLLRARHLLGKNPEKTVLALPELKDRVILSMMTIIARVGPSASFSAPEFFGFLILYRLNLMLKHGLPDFASDVLIGYSAILTSIRDYNRSYLIGELAMKLTQGTKNISAVNNTWFGFGIFVSPWKKPASQSFEYLNWVYQSMIDNGNLIMASYAANFSGFIKIFTSQNLDLVNEDISRYQQFLEKSRQDVSLQTIYLQFILNLKGKTLRPVTFSTEDFNEDLQIKEMKISENKVHLHWFWICKMVSHSLYEQLDSGIEASIQAEKVVEASRLYLPVVFHAFFQNLLIYQKAEGKLNSLNRTQTRLVKRNEKWLAGWKKHTPENSAHLVLILSALKKQATGTFEEILKQFEFAASEARKNNSVLFEAMANEFAGRYANMKGFPTIARSYLVRARYGYQQWGATGKVAQMDKKYGDLPDGLLESQSRPDKPVLDLSPVRADSLNFDLYSILKASQAISGEIVRQNLLEKLLTICLENAGAVRAVLLLYRYESLTVEAEGVSGKGIRFLNGIQSSAWNKVPQTVLQYVRRTNAPLVVDDISRNDRFRHDPYIQKESPKSILCIPIIRQNKSVGMIYLENNLVTNAFPPERVNVLSLISAQAAISIENARLYDELESRVSLRNQEVLEKNRALEETLRKLKQAQGTLVQTEKMASIGQLTAGIAHEINNPINFVTGNIDPLVRDFDELVELLNAYRQLQTGPHLAKHLAEIEKFREKIDEEVLIDEIHLLIKGIRDGARRTAEIVKGLRLFSRLDESNLKPANLNDGLESTLTLLNSRFNGRIKLIKNLGVLPEVDCLAGQLNQVFMNIVSNAIDAIPDKGEITVETLQEQDRVKIRISDSGTGMTEEVKQKCFEPFFTTKEIGKGTGLGLAISYAIIEKHKGTMHLDSVAGKGTTFTITLPIHQVGETSSLI